MAGCTHKTPAQREIGSHASQTASRFELQDLRRYREGVANGITLIQGTSNRDGLIEITYYKSYSVYVRLPRRTYRMTWGTAGRTLSKCDVTGPVTLLWSKGKKRG